MSVRKLEGAEATEQTSAATERQRCLFTDRDARVSLSPLSPTQQLTMSFSMRICLITSLPFSAADSPSPD